MKFTIFEIRFFNAISKGPEKLFGLDLESNKKSFSEKDDVNKTIKSLQEKNVLDSDKKLTKLGLVPVRAFELYKTAKEYYQINKTLIAVREKENWIALIPCEEGFDLFVTHPAAILKKALDELDFLRKAQLSKKQSSETNEPIKVSNLFLIRHTIDKKRILSNVYFWDEENGYVYDELKTEKRCLGSRDMRVELLNILGLSKFQNEEMHL